MNKKIIWITGIHGFIGRHLESEMIKNPDNQVFGLGTSCHLGIDHNCISKPINANNLDILLSKSGNPNYIFHLSGGSSVPLSIKNPLEDFNKTVNATEELLDWMRRRTCDAKLLIVSSAAVYGDCSISEIPEDNVTNPLSPYGLHKSLIEKMSKYYAKNYNLKLVIVRLFSVYGIGLRRQIIWETCRRIFENSDELLFSGTGLEKRDWLNIGDAISLLIFSIKLADYNSPIYNGGSGKPLEVREMVNKICSVWGSKIPIRFDGITRAGDPFSLVASLKKINSCGWTPKVNINTGLIETVAWVKRNII